MVNVQALWDRLRTVPDPEIPVISIVDLGVVRAIAIEPDGACTVTLTPTYSGCPATEVITQDVKQALLDAGCTQVNTQLRLTPTWTTDWLNETAKSKLRDYGIAPPQAVVRAEQRIGLSAIGGLSKYKIACPRCDSMRTENLSQHGSTPCKAQYRCLACLEPFDYFKPH